MYKITVLAHKPLSLYVIKDGKEQLVSLTKRGQILYTECLTDALNIYQEDRKIKIAELRSKPAKETKEATVVIPVEELLDPLAKEINPSEPAKKRRKQRVNKNIAEE